LILGLVVAATFYPVLGADFVHWDDDVNFLRNPHFRGLGLPQLRWMTSTVTLGHYTPVAWLTFGADYVVWGLRPFGYHLTNLLLHGLNTLLAYALARRLLAPGAPPSGAEPGITIGAAFAALVFALHPLRVESVAWVTERRGVLAAFFCLASTLAYLRDAARPARGDRRWYGASLGLFMLALLSKGIAVAFPAALVALDVYPLRRAAWSMASWRAPGGRRAVLEKLPFVALAAASALGTTMAAWDAVARPSAAPLGFLERLVLLGHALGFHLRKTIVPTDLSPLYELKLPLGPLGWTLAEHALMAGLLVGLAVRVRRRWPAVLAAVLVFGAFIAPVSGLMQAGPQMAADRYTYIAGLGLAFLGGAPAAHYWWSGRARPRPAVVAALLVTVLAGLGVLSWRQTHVWHDSESLWARALEVDPTSSVAAHNLAVGLAVVHPVAAGASPAPATLAIRDRDVRVDSALRYFNLAVSFHQSGDLDRAMAYYARALAVDPRFAEAWNNLGGAHAARGELREALGAFVRALEIDPAADGACANGRRTAAALGVTVPALARCAGGRGAAG
jgi:hypothetical protein